MLERPSIFQCRVLSCASAEKLKMSGGSSAVLAALLCFRSSGAYPRLLPIQSSLVFLP